MPELIYVACALAGLILILLLIMTLRAIAFKDKGTESAEGEKIEVRADELARSLSEMIKCKTVSSSLKDEEDESEFIKFKKLLPKIFPYIYKKCVFEEVGSRAILYRLKGESETNPTVLMAHYDVVFADEALWDKPAFGGIIEDGYIWGRGAVDTKVTLNGIMSALNEHIKEGFVPKSDIYLAFSGNEEISGDGAPSVVDIFEKRGIAPGFVLDEGGAVVSGAFPGVKEPCAMVGIAEKGMLNLEISYTCGGGHASTPPVKSPLGVLSRACLRVEKHPFRMRYTKPTAEMFRVLGGKSKFLYRFIFANFRIFSPLIDLASKKFGGELNALLRTTCAFTQIEGTRGMNVIPPKVSCIANLRLIEGETKESAIKHLKRVIRDPRVEIKAICGNNPSVISKTDTEGYEKIKTSIQQCWDKTVVSPYLMFACSDSRHWGRISDKVYRFSALTLTKEERASIHGNNEKISLENIAKNYEFYYKLIKKC